MQEYDRISSAYFGLRGQVNEMFKAYLTLVGLPLTVLAAVLNISAGQMAVSLGSLPDIVSALLVAVAGLGLLVALTIVFMRMSMIRHARTINLVRRYFADMDLTARPGAAGQHLIDYLVLPTRDVEPPFFEPLNAIFWQLAMIGVLDGGIAAVGLYNLLPLLPVGALLVGLLGVLMHLGIYSLVAWYHSVTWQKRFSSRPAGP